MSILPVAPESDLETEVATPDQSLEQGRRWRRLSSRVLGALLGLTLFGLYLSILARNDITTFIASLVPALPGSRFVVPVLLAVVALGLAGVLVARSARLSGWRIWREALVRSWVVEHAVPLAVGAVTLGALAVRIFGISDNLPYVSYPDEPAVADRALKIIQTGDFNPHYFVYPSLYYYMQAGVYIVRFFALVSAGKLLNLDGAQPVDFYLWGRILTAVLGTLTVPLVYLAGRRLYGQRYGAAVGLIAAVFIAASSLHIVFSQLITTDVPAAFFSALSLFTIARLLPAEQLQASKQPNLDVQPYAPAYALAPYSRYLLAGAAMGFALSTKYNSALVLLPFLVAHLCASWDVRGDRLRVLLGPKLWVGLASTVAAFLITTPFAIFDLPTFLNDVASVVSHYNFGHLGHEGDDNWLFYIRSFLSTDTIPTLLTLAGVALAFARHKRPDIVALSFPLLFYLSMSSYRVNFTRNLLPILPFTSILAALPMALAWRWALEQSPRWMAPVRKRLAPRVPGNDQGAGATWLLAIIVALSVLVPAYAAVRRGYRQSQPDARLRASRWLDANTRSGTKLWLEASGPMLTPGRYITGQSDHIVDHPMSWYVANRAEYLVLNAGAYKSIVYDQPDSQPSVRDAYLSFFKENEQRLVVSFDSNETDTPGPTVKIYRAGYAPPQRAQGVKAQHPIGALFHETGANQATVQLIGADYPSTATVGSALPLILYWSPDKKMSSDYTMFVHLVNAKGDTAAQRDTGPRNGTYPTSSWPAGEVVVDEAFLDLPQNLAPGNYMLRVGIYLQQGGKAVGAFAVGNAPPGSGQDFVAVGPVTIAGNEK